MNGMKIVDIAVLGVASENQVIHFGHVKSQNDERIRWVGRFHFILTDLK